MNERDKYKRGSRYIRIYDDCEKLLNNDIDEFKVTKKVISELDYIQPSYDFLYDGDGFCVGAYIEGIRNNKSDILRKNYADKLEMEFNPINELYIIRKIRR